MKVKRYRVAECCTVEEHHNGELVSFKDFEKLFKAAQGFMTSKRGSREDSTAMLQLWSVLEGMGAFPDTEKLYEEQEEARAKQEGREPHYFRPKIYLRRGDDKS